MVLRQYKMFIKLCAKKMVKMVIRKLLKTTLCQLFWFVIIMLLVTFVITVWMSDESQANKVIVRNEAEHPVIFWWTPGFWGSLDLTKCPNDVKCYVYNDRKHIKDLKVGAYLFYGSGMIFDDLPLPRRPKDVIWGLFHEESPRNVEELLHEEALNLFNYSSTYSRYSDVPFPLLHLTSFDDITSKKYFVATPLKNEFLGSIAPVMYLQSDCTTSTERDEYVKELMKYIKVDSYGSCLKNRQLPAKFQKDYLNNLNEDEFLRFTARYKFVIAIENGVCNDYVTEKFWRAIKVGSVPIYFGSPSVRDWLPNSKSAILLDDFPTPKILSDHINTLMTNNTLYDEYLLHKTKQIVTNVRLSTELELRPYQIQDNGMASIREFECFVCKKLYEKMNGGNIGVRIMNKSHYDCPRPLSALSLSVNPWNSWVSSRYLAGERVKEIYKTIYDRY